MSLTDVSRGGLDLQGASVVFSSVSSFKGLEADMVRLVDVADLTSAEALAAVYVEASRARVALYVFMSKGVSDRLEDLAREFGRSLAVAARPDARNPSP